MLMHQRDRTLQRDDRRIDVGAALEPRRGFGLQAEPLAGAADGRRLEIRALERHRFGLVGDLGAAPPMTPATACASFAIGDHQHVGVERPLDAVERRDRFTGAGATNPQRAAVERVEIEGVHRMPELHQHVVGDVDERADRAHAGRLEPRRHPAGVVVAETSATAAA